MSKEMIISVNGREKKIAIVENGQVTEFYIERGEENSGVVGNIYKGRVQRVLPGMQSAFVEIGLERDAFLYVSDFFDEEEEFERIMLEKTKKTPPDVAEREAAEQLKKARLEREQQIEEIQEIVEPLTIETEEEPDGTFEAVAETTEETFADDSRGGRGKKSRRGKKGRNAETETKSAAPIGEERSAAPAVIEEIPSDEPGLDYEPLFDFEEDAGSFERVIDDEETTGEMFKDAYMQEAIVDKVRAIEFDMESTSTAEVGSLFDAVSDAPNGFQRIADEDEPVAEATTARAEEAKPAKSKRGRGGKRDKNQSAGTFEETVTETPAAESAAGEDSKKKRGRGKSEKSKVEAKSPRGKKSARAKDETQAQTVTENSAETNSKAPQLADGEASLSESSSAAAEMSVRRGGRRRGGNRGGSNRGGRQQQARSGPTEDRYETSKMDETISSAENEFADAEMVEHSGGKSGGYAGGNGKSERRRGQPTITDLLREGQEILVQIAKEPIARKGARITSHIALPGRYLVYMPTIEHVGVSRKIESGSERSRLRTLIQKIRNEEDVPSGGFIVRTAGIGVPEENLRDDARYLVRTWKDIKRQAEKSKSPALVHQDLDIVQRILRDQLSDDFAAIRVDSEEEYLRIVEFVNRIQPRMVNRVKLYTREEPILEAFNVQEEVDKALKPRVWLKSGGYLVINQTEALVAIDVNTGKFVGKGNARLEDTITKTNMEAVEEISRQIRLRDLGGIIVLDLIDMEDRRNRQKVLQALQESLSHDKSPTKVLSFNDFGLIIMTRKRVKQSLERTLCSPCEYCQSSGWVKSPQTVCYNILEEARRLSRHADDVRQTTLRVHPEVLKALRGEERSVLDEIEAYLGYVDITSDAGVHQEQFDFAFI
jgi:ribonuclease G